MKSRLRGWKFWVLVGVLVTATLLMLAQDQETLKVESPVAADDPRFVDYVASLIGTPMHRGDELTVLRNGVEVFPAMLDAIGKAQKRISFESFIYEDGEVGDSFTQALIAAARRGVDVRVVLDAFGGELSEASRQKLTDAGVHLVWFNPIRPWTLEETNYRTHRKILVVDGAVAFAGGVGLANHWIGNADAAEHWRDTHFRIVGPSVRAFEAGFYENWLESGGSQVPMLDPDAPARDNGTRSLVAWSNPTGGASNVKLLYLLAIAGARRSIDIQSPYFILDESTRWSLGRARARGVRVRVLTDGDITDSMAVKHAAREGYQDLLEQGHEIYEFQPTMMHVKAMIIDGVFSVGGSANFDNRSFELNDELTFAVGDPTLAAALTRDFEHDLERAKQIVPEEWRQRGIIQRLKEHFWAMFGELF